MAQPTLSAIRIFALVFAGMIAAGPALAEKPSWAGDKRGKQEQQKGKAVAPQNGGASGISVSVHFGDRQRAAVHEYFSGQFRAGRCPPGLAKKNNGCMPPGLAKQWTVGKPLPHDLVIYDLPPKLVVKLGVPPQGHKYVRVAGDILLIAVGTAMVVDAIEDLGNM